MATSSRRSSRTVRAATILTDEKIDSLDTHLEQFKIKNSANQNELQVILKEFSQLLEDYQVLKKKALESKDERQDGVQIVNQAIRKPYVLMLVDGNNYIFRDDLLKAREDGGRRAAHILCDAVQKYLRQSHPELTNQNYRLIVRVYADLTTLSKTLAKDRLTGLEKRSLAPFSAGFTRARSHFDFIDTLDEMGTRFKIGEMLKDAGEDEACSHILYAACNDPSFFIQVYPFIGLQQQHKITLVHTGGIHSQFDRLGLNITQFPSFFRSFDTTTPSSSKPIRDLNLWPTNTNSASISSSTNSPNDFPSKHFPDTFVDILDTATWDANNISSVEKLGYKSKSESKTKGEHKPISSKVPCRYFRLGRCNNGDNCPYLHEPVRRPTSRVDRTNVSAKLPTVTRPDYVSLNRDNQRIDAYMKPPTEGEWDMYNDRFRRKKPCNTFHLTGICMSFNCVFDHTMLSSVELQVLKYILKCHLCPRKGACRLENCFYGHLCQKDGCTGQMKGCKMKPEAHAVDPIQASVVPALRDGEEEDEERNFEEEFTAEVQGAW